MEDFWQWVEGVYRNKNNCPYFGDGGSGVLPLAQNTGRYLINMRGQDVNEGGTYGVFGGGIFLDETPYETIEELAKTNYPLQHALKELHEESGYNGAMQCTEVYVYKDNKKNHEGKPCNFFYWNFVGVCSVEFPVQPGSGYEWEEAGSKWITLQELWITHPMHFGLKSLITNAKNKLIQFVHQTGFNGDEQYQHQVITKPLS